MAALTFKGLLPPATAAIRAAPRYAHLVAREEWERVDNLPDMGLDGEKPPTNEIHQSNRLCLLQELAATFLDRVNAGGDSEMAAAAFCDFAVGGRF